MAVNKSIDATLDTSEAVEVGDGVPKVKVAPGTYNAIVASAKLDKSKGGTPMVVAQLAIKGGTFSGEQLPKYMVLRGKGAGFTRKALLAFYDDDAMGEGFRVNPDDLIGERCVIVVESELYKHPEHTNKHRDDGMFESRKVSDILRADDEAAQSAVTITENTLADADKADAETPF